LEVEKYLGSLSLKLHSLAQTIVDTRKALQEENYEDILVMNQQNRFEFTFTVGKSFDAWTSRVLASIKEEVRLCEASFNLCFSS
jgi:hypothetical protein